MQKKEFSSPKYEYSFVGGEKNTFSFQTINRFTYDVTFKPTPYLFDEGSVYSHYTYEFSIILVSNTLEQNPPFDPKIPPTIAAIFTDFYENAVDTITIYICDSSDGRQMTRRRKFDKWFDYFKGESFIKIDAKFKESDGTQYPVSLIIKESNPFRTQIFDEFLNVVSGYNAGK